MKIAILGWGREGRSVYDFYNRLPQPQSGFAMTDNDEIWILDENPDIKTPTGLKTQLGPNYLDNLEEFDVIYRSPGFPYWKLMRSLDSPASSAGSLGMTAPLVVSATKLFFDKCNCKIIGITGTKGKGTTATLLYNILKACGRDVYLVGNIGMPALDILPKLKPDSLVVFELSSFQLQDLHKSPAIAVVLDIFPDHQDAHRSYEEYVEAKCSILKNQIASNKAFFFNDNNEIPRLRSASLEMTRCEIDSSCPQSLRSSVAGGRKAQNDWRDKLQIPGEHNLKNAVMAYQVAKYLGCPEEKILKEIFQFKGMEHRLELVNMLLSRCHSERSSKSEVEESQCVQADEISRQARDDVRFINDSASTNPQTTLAAIRAFKEPKILIVGGKDKGLDYSVWAEEFPKNNVKAVILFGENKEKLQVILSDSEESKRSVELRRVPAGTRLHSQDDLIGAVKLAKKIAVSGDIVLFSPGAASFDMFKDYAERGQKFKNIVQSL